MPPPAASHSLKSNKPGFHSRLLEWYAAHGRRHLPWRNTRDAYAIYISEVMLQQTQVKTILERFYFPFLERFATLAALARAPQQDVLSAWQGLGYYNRARNLHKAAQMSGGELPDSIDGLMALPGIGRNTAHAVAAFAYRQPVPVMEANLKRVLSRVYALERPGENELWEKAYDLLDRSNPFDYNQAMMDIGALVCTRRNPRCGECPAQAICLGSAQPERFPAAKAAKAAKVRRKRIVVLRNTSGQYHLTRRSTRFLSGLYHFCELDDNCSAVSLRGREYALENARLLGHVQQQYSHFTLEADIYLLSGIGHKGKNWHTLSKINALPVSIAEKKILALVTSAKAIVA